MTDIGEAVMDAVATMAAVSFCLMGVAVRQEPGAQAAKPQQIVVRRLPAQKPTPAVTVVRSGKDRLEPHRA